MDDFVGNWVNVDPNTRGMTRLLIERQSATGASFHGFGKCHPRDCDWGETAASLTGEVLRGVYRFSFKNTHIDVRRSGEDLQATVLDDYTERDGRTDRRTAYLLRRKTPPVDKQRPKLALELGALERTTPHVSRCRCPIHSKEEFDRLFSVLTDGSYRAYIEIHCTATIGRLVRNRVSVQGTSVFIAPNSPMVSKPQQTIRPVVGPARTPIRPLPPQNSGAPVLVQSQVTCTQAIDPFWFNTETHGYMFDLPDNPGSNHVLLKKDVHVGGKSVTFFQDSTLRSQAYYEPQEFLLPRVDVAPYSPNLLFAFKNVIGDDNVLSYSVDIGYQVVPHIDPVFLNQARLDFEGDVSFTALMPVDSRLSLRLPVGEGDDLVDVDRDEADVTFDEGILDEIDLTPSQFQRVFASFQSPNATGCQGSVKATLLDGSEVDIPVRLSLRENAGVLFDRWLTADREPGIYHVELRNRIESEVTISSVLPVFLGARAAAQYLGNVPLPVSIAPQESITLDYRVSPPDAPVFSLEPNLETDIAVDYGKLWPAITVNEGYSDATFDIEVAVVPGVFDASSDAMEPLTGIRIDFDSAVSVELTPQQPSKVVSLRMPLLAFLMNSPDAMTYQYQVANLHAGGAAGLPSDWIAGIGNLMVTPQTSP